MGGDEREHEGDKDGGLTRRRLIGGAAAGAAVAALPGAAEARRRAPVRRPVRRRADVIVVGAGLAGLTAAREVVRRGRSVIVLEARRRVGGRTLNAQLGGGKVVEIGGQWIGPTQDHMAKLAKDVGVGTFKTYNEGSYVYHRNGRNTRYTPNTPIFGAVPPDPTGAAEAAKALAQLDQMAATVPRDAPWTAPNAREYDSQTFETWKLNNTSTESGRFLLDLGIESVFAAEPRDISLLHVLFYINSAGNETTPGTFERLINTAGGAQESRFVGGSQLVSLKVARRLGKRIILGAPARRILQSPRGVTVVSDKLSVSGKQVIVAMAPAITAHIDFEPQLPILRDQLTQRMPMGSVIKCEAVYDAPFWRNAGLTGQATSDAGPCKITFDNSPPDGKPGVLLGFIEGEEARAMSSVSPARRRAAVLASFARYYGSQALDPRRYIEMNWSGEKWSRGGYVGFTPPGVLLDYGSAIRARFRRVHWAGTETSPIWNGYMDGAVRSGERAAREALRHL